MSESRPLVPSDRHAAATARFERNYERHRQRAFSGSSLDPNEDPVSGLERVASQSDAGAANLRRRREQDERNTSAQNRRDSKDDHETLSSKFESLDYEIIDSQLYREEEKEPGHQRRLWRSSFNRWIVCFLIGLGTALIAVAIDIMVHMSARIKFGMMIHALIKGCNKGAITASSGCMWWAELAWMGYNCVLVFIAACLVVFLAPTAKGSGIPQVKCFLNGINIPEILRLKTLFAKSVGVACAVSGGLCAGKEGPMIHSGACVGGGVSQGRATSFKFDTGLFEEFRNDREKRDFVSAGAAAGVAAAFGAPIGGVLFSLEEGASFWNQSLTWRMFFSAMISSFTVNFLLSFYYGQNGQLSWSGLANFGVFENESYNVWEIPFFLAIGAIGGVLGALFNFCNGKLTEFRNKHVRARWQCVLEVILIASASAHIGFCTMYLIDDCQPIGVNPNMTEVTQLWCKKGEYSAIASLFFRSPEESVKSLFHAPINSFRPTTLLIFAVEYYVLTAWTFGCSVPSGVFIPLLLTGAAWGRLVGLTVESLFPNITGIDPGKYAFAGAAAMLGGVVRMTISLTAILMEATKNITFGLPLMLVLMVAKWVGDVFNEGVYDIHIAISEIPLLGWNPPRMSRNISAQQVMRRDVVALEERERVSRVVQVLRETLHNAFPVVDRIAEPTSSNGLPVYGRLRGLITRRQLITLLHRRAFLNYQGDLGVEGSPIKTADFNNDFVKQLKSIDDLPLTTRDYEEWLDIAHFMNVHPHRVQTCASLPFVFRLFRGLGLRYLVVVNDENKVRGVITRKDVARYREKRHGRTYLLHELYVAEYH